MKFVVAVFFFSAIALSSGRSIPSEGLPTDGPTLARFVVTRANWTSLAFVSKKCGGYVKACPSNAVFSMSDGKEGCGSGIPYFWTTDRHPVVVELESDPRVAITVGLTQTDICKKQNWDPQDPRCAQVFLHGKFHRIEESDPEYQVAKEALFTRHPQFNNYPPSHKFFCAKMNITKIEMIGKFGGATKVDLKEYYKVKLC